MDQGNYTITIDHEHSLVRVIARGFFSIPSGYALITEARTKAAEYGFKLVYNLKETKTKASFTDWFYLPRKLAAFRDPRTRRIQAALIVPDGEEEKKYRFLETVARNLSLNIRVFLDEDAALEWLDVMQAPGD